MPYNTVEKGEKKMSTETKVTVRSQEQVKEKFGVRALVNIGMLAAIAIILMLF